MILVTGGTGLLGSHLLIELSKKHDNINALYRTSSKINLVHQLFKYYYKEEAETYFKKITWIEGNILDIEGMSTIIKNSTIVYHCAALVSFHPSDFDRLFKINREGTANIVNLCLAYQVKKLCYVSSTAALGKKTDGAIDETTPWENNRKQSGYALSKYAAEKEVWRGIEEGLDAIIVNPSVMFGAGDWDESSLTIFRTIQKGLKYYTDGVNGIVDARDVAKIMVQLTESDLKNERYILVGHVLPFKELFEKIAKALKVKAPHILVKPWLMGLTWRIISVISFLTRKKPVITKHTAKTAFNQTFYNTNKIKNKLNITFIGIEDTIENTINGKIENNIHV